jgi:hypothetical protein
MFLQIDWFFVTIKFKENIFDKSISVEVGARRNMEIF